MEGAEGVNSAGPPRIAYIPGLDGLRGLAVAATVYFHTGHLDGGYLGVDLFFVLSGYLITTLLLAETNRAGRIDLPRFWGRRARRLLPALALMLIGVAAYARFAAEETELHRIRGDGIATMLYVANWHEIFAARDYWSVFSAPSPLQHTWSLAIEEQFYVLWPLLLGGVYLLLRRRRRTRSAEPVVLAVVVTCGLASLASQAWWQSTRGWDRVYYGTDTRAFALCAGAAVAAWVAWRGPARDGRPRRLLEASGMVGAAFLAVAWTTFGGSSAVVRHGGLALCSVAAAAVVAAIAHPDRGPLARLVGFTPLRLLGVISYGVYLFHWPIMVWLSPDRVHTSEPVRFVAQVGVTLAVAIASYHFVEQPVRHGQRWPAVRAAVVPTGCFVVVITLLVASTATSRFTELDTSPNALHRAAASTRTFSGTTLMVIGDSVGFNLAVDGFERLETEPATRTVNAAVPGCQYPPAPHVIGWNGDVTEPTGPITCDRDWIGTTQAYAPKYVIYIRSSTEPIRIQIGKTFASPCTATYQQHYRSLLQNDIDRFAERGARTVFVTALPIVKVPSMSGAVFAEEVRSTTCGNTTLREVAAANTAHVELVDLEAELCPTPSTCRVDWQGVELRHDRTHYKGRSARLVAAWILEQIGIRMTGGVD